MMDSALSINNVFRASRLLEEKSPGSSTLELRALRGQLTEICAPDGHPQVTLAIDLIAQAHQQGEPAVWVGGSSSLFYPPDASDWNLDWSALALIRVDGAHRVGRAADKLLRSAAFGVVVLDLCGLDGHRLPSPLMGRLMRVAESHDSAAVFLTSSDDKAPSLSPLIALRARARWTDVAAERLEAKYSILKDKRRGPGRQFREVYNGPMGLR